MGLKLGTMTHQEHGETDNANIVLFSEPELKLFVVNKFFYDYNYLARYSYGVFVMALCSTLEFMASSCEDVAGDQIPNNLRLSF